MANQISYIRHDVIIDIPLLIGDALKTCGFTKSWKKPCSHYFANHHRRQLGLVNAVLWPVKAVTRDFRSLTFKCLKRRTTGSFKLARCCGLTLMTVTTTIMEFNLSPLELCVELDKMFSIPLRRATDIPTVSKTKQRKSGDATKTYTLRLSTFYKHLPLKSWFSALKSGLSW